MLAMINKYPDLFILLFLSRRCRGVGSPANNNQREQNQRELTKSHEMWSTGAGNRDREPIHRCWDLL
jgi:hypothetical protein